MIRYSILLSLAVPLAGLAEPRIAVVGESLGDARARYAAVTSVQRRDCDPADGGRWVCASFDDPVLADVGGPAPVAPPSDRPPAIGAVVIGDTLADARARYAAATSQPRGDCDPVGDGRWLCASYDDPVLADLTGAPPPVVVPEPETPPVVALPGPVSPPIEERPPSSSGSARVQAENLGLSGAWRVEAQREGFTGTGYALWRGDSRTGRPGDGITDIPLTLPAAGEYRLVIRAQAVDAERGDTSNDTFFRFPGGAWTKVYTTGRDAWQTGGTADRDGRKFPFTAMLPAGEVTLQMSARSPRHAIDWIELQRVGAPGASTPPDRAADLISLHYDSAPDWDDLQAMIANRLILEKNPADVLVVNGAIGDKRNRADFIEGSTKHCRAVHGACLDYFDDRDATVDKVATAWALTLNGGGKVRVADGGPMDLSADVIRELERRGVSRALLKRIDVVQHSSSFNTGQTSDAGLALVRSRTNYITIPNGNAPDNGSADLEQQGTAFERLSLETKEAALWANAYRFVRSERRVDFSDSVELLHILGLPNDGGVLDFYRRYMQPAGPGNVAAPDGGADARLVSTGVTPMRTPGGLGWADSYIGTDGQCWPASTWDHGIGAVRVDTSAGRMTIREAADRLGDAPERRDDLAFNDINCGNGPANDAGDEAIDQCPGLVTRGRAGCGLVATAPAWWTRL